MVSLFSILEAVKLFFCLFRNIPVRFFFFASFIPLGDITTPPREACQKRDKCVIERRLRWHFAIIDLRGGTDLVPEREAGQCIKTQSYRTMQLI